MIGHNNAVFKQDGGGEDVIQPWSTAPVEGLQIALEKARLGMIDLNDYWSVGMIRPVHLQEVRDDDDNVVISEQDIELILMDKNCVGFTCTDSYNPNFVVGMRGCLVDDVIEKDATITIVSSRNREISNLSYSNSNTKAFCNNYFKESLGTLSSIFREFNWKVLNGDGVGSGSTSYSFNNEEDNIDTFAIPNLAMLGVYGVKLRLNPAPSTDIKESTGKLEYYNNVSNLKKNASYKIASNNSDYSSYGSGSSYEIKIADYIIDDTGALMSNIIADSGGEKPEIPRTIASLSIFGII